MLRPLLIAALLLVWSGAATADCSATECRGSPPVQVDYDVSGNFAVVVNGNSSLIGICDGSGLNGRAIAILEPGHANREGIIAAIQASYFLGEPVRLFFENTPNQRCRIRNFNQER